MSDFTRRNHEVHIECLCVAVASLYNYFKRFGILQNVIQTMKFAYTSYCTVLLRTNALK